MDSGNSGSMQSSSGGDEEYDSRAESISAFLNNNNNNPLSHVGPMLNNQPPQPERHHHHHHQTQLSPSSSTMLFDPLSNYFDPLAPPPSSSRPPPTPTNPSSLLNLDMVWSKNLRSDPSCTDLGGFISSSLPTQQFTNQAQNRNTFQSLPSHGQESAARVPGSGSVSGTNDQVSNTVGVRNPKKRSRASRRAPTTVLTTDTTNFRAMVQEFTGIPAPPFTSSPFPRSRLDLFGTAASALRSAVSHHLDPSPPPYLLRPFAQKFQPPAPPFASSGSTTSSFSTSSMIDAMASTTTTNINNSGTCNNSITSNISLTSINYQLPSDLGLLKQPHNSFNINVQNPILNFHPLLQAPPKYPLSNSPNILGTAKPQEGSSLEIPSNDSHLKMGVLEELGLSHSHVSTNLSGIQNVVSSSSSADATVVRRSDHNNSLTNWGDGVGSNEADHHHHQQGFLRSINGDYNNSTQRVTNGKVNFLASSSDFRGDNKLGQENVATRSEGMMESWICSSD